MFKKKTSVIHALIGVLIIFGEIFYPNTGIILLIAFLAFEAWQYIDHRRKGIKTTGVTDFWECVVGITIAECVVLILRACDVCLLCLRWSIF